MQSSARPANRLSLEKSPYLLQHQYNPVHWWPWSEEAFAQAHRLDRPVMVSIGYSTCHWCHVMERESFEDVGIGEFLNAHFICIKVDREERPDVDKIYMMAAQFMGAQGGWPLNVFVTPDRQPFFAGTYFPPVPKHGRASFIQVLNQLTTVWQTRRDEVDATAQDLVSRLKGLSDGAAQGSAPKPDGEVLDNAAQACKTEYEPHHGGFGGAPKFPRPCQPRFLLRYGLLMQDREAIEMVLHTCRAMADGGIHDQIGGGFARYSVDAQWLVPHFEKMLYDNAQLIVLYLEAYLASNDPMFAEVVHSTVRYVLRDMTDPLGGFYSAEDADSEGKEGKFYCWTEAELNKLLTPEEMSFARDGLGVTSQGNFLDHSDPDPLLQQNVLSIVFPALCETKTQTLATVRGKLMAARATRVRPHRDDKVLVSWNGMMLGALAQAGVILGEKSWLEAAERNAAFVRNHLWNAKTKQLHHRWREGQRDNVQLLDAYANWLAGLIDLYEATLAPQHLEFAIEVADSMITQFQDPANGGFYQGPASADDLIFRVKDDYDGAEPAGNSVAVLALLRLSALTGRTDYGDIAAKVFLMLAERLHRLPQAVPVTLLALLFAEAPCTKIVIASETLSGVEDLLHAAHSVIHPRRVVLGTTGPVAPIAREMRPPHGMPAAYVCTSSECLPPVTDPTALRAILSK